MDPIPRSNSSLPEPRRNTSFAPPPDLYREGAINNQTAVHGDVFFDSPFDPAGGFPSPSPPPLPPSSPLPKTDLSYAYPVLPLGSNLELDPTTGQHVLNLPNAAPSAQDNDVHAIIQSFMEIERPTADVDSMLHPNLIGKQPLIRSPDFTTLVPKPVPARLRKWIDDTTRNAGVHTYSKIPGTENYGPAQRVYTVLMCDGKITGYYSHQDGVPDLPLPQIEELLQQGGPSAVADRERAPSVERHPDAPAPSRFPSDDDRACDDDAAGRRMPSGPPQNEGTRSLMTVSEGDASDASSGEASDAAYGEAHDESLREASEFEDDGDSDLSEGEALDIGVPDGEALEINISDGEVTDIDISDGEATDMSDDEDADGDVRHSISPTASSASSCAADVAEDAAPPKFLDRLKLWSISGWWSRWR